MKGKNDRLTCQFLYFQVENAQKEGRRAFGTNAIIRSKIKFKYFEETHKKTVLHTTEYGGNLWRDNFRSCLLKRIWYSISRNRLHRYLFDSLVKRHQAYAAPYLPVLTYIQKYTIQSIEHTPQLICQAYFIYKCT